VTRRADAVEADGCSAAVDPPAHTFTVFTPTYDRAHTLPRVYDSLRHQTFADFEWLIVDDGSRDGTRDLVARWRAENPFRIRYVTQEHAGKHVAANRAVELARGELFLTLDSDDACVPDALERLKRHWDAIPAGERDRYAAVTGLCVDQDGRLVGDRYPGDVLDSDPIELVYRYGVKGEKWGFTRTSILRHFPFPTANGMTFVPEGVVWDSIGLHYRTRYVNEALRVYWIRTGGEPDAARPGPIAPGHALGLATWHAFILNHHLRWFPHAPIRFLASAIHYTRFSALAGDGPMRQLAGLQTTGGRVLWALVAPLGWAVYAIDRLRTRRQ
jgi:glycosyltransferase involved in cell wall biosynthesis